MIQPGMMFGGEGPIMQGTWYNPSTGDAFTVRDSFFEDNQYVVTSTDGRYFRYDQLKNYIQSDMKLEDLKKMKSENKVKEKEELPTEVANLIDNDNEFGMLPEDEALIKPKLGNLYTKPQYTPQLTNTTELQNSISNNNSIQENVDNEYLMNIVIIEKALKNSSQPTFNISIDWENYPEKEIEMLKDIMNISPENIVDWYLDNIQLADFIIKFKDAIKNRILSNTEEIIETPVEENTIINSIEEDSVPKKSTKKSKKK